MNVLRRIDDAWARFESRLTLLVLIAMVLVAGMQATIRNLTFHDVQWASDMLMDVEWADSFLRKGTLWLAFLGASLATYYEKHIGIDVLQRIAPPRARWNMKALTSFLAAIVTFGLVVAFSDAVVLNLTERPIEYEVLAEDGPQHVCDASAAYLEELSFVERPSIFCAARSTLAVFGVPAETPGAAFQIIVPIMFFVMALRLFGKGVGAVMVLKGGDAAIAAADAADDRTTSTTPPPSADEGDAVFSTGSSAPDNVTTSNKDES